MAPPLRRRVCLAPLLLATLAVPAGAHAAEPVTGGTEVTLDGTAATALRAAGVRFVAVEPATASRRRITLPASSAAFGTTTTVRHTGVLQLVRGTGRRARRVAVTGARTRLHGQRSTVSARLGTRRLTWLALAPVDPRVDAATGTARVTASVSLTRPAARLLRKRLGLPRFAVRRLGTARLAVARPPATVATPAPAAGTGTSATAAATPTGNVAVAALTWRPRESFVRYINAEPGNGIVASEGAVAGAPEVRPPSSAPLVYAFGYPFTAGNTDPTRTSLAFTGRVSFRWPGRGIDLQFAAPQLTLGATSSASFVLGGTTAGARAGQLTRTLDLQLGAAASHTTSGTTETYTDVPATLTAEGAEAFAGFYQPGTDFGTVTTSFTRTP